MADTVEGRRARAKPKASIKGEEITSRGSRINLGDPLKSRGYFEQRYPWSERVRVEFKDDAFIDSVKGLNKGHALSRAAANWPDARRIVALGGKILKYAAKLGSAALGPPDVRKITEQKRVE